MTYNILEKIIHFSYTIISHIPFAKKIVSFFGIKHVIGFGRNKGIIITKIVIGMILILSSNISVRMQLATKIQFGK